MRKLVDERRSRAAAADHDRPLRLDTRKDGSVGRVAAQTDERVHGRQLAADDLRDRRLVRRRDVRPGEPERVEALHRGFEPVRRHVDSDVRPVEPPRGERSVLHTRRERMRDRVAEQRDELAHL